MIEAHLAAIFHSLKNAQVEYLIVGGLAVVAHGHPRFTADLDLVVSLDRENARRAIAALGTLGYVPLAPVEAAQFAEAAVRRSWIEEKGMKVFQMRSEAQIETCIDLFVEEPFDFAREFARAPRLELVEGHSVPVVAFEALIAMKRAAGRPRDLDDIANLERGREDGEG